MREAERLLAAINARHQEYYEIAAPLADPVEASRRLQEAMDRSLQDSKAALERHRSDDVNQRVLEKEQEMSELMAQLDNNEQRLKTLAA